MARAGQVAGRLGRAALDLLFPPRCVGCGSSGAFLCDGCSSSLVRALPPRCPYCWQPSSDGGACPGCHLDPSGLDGLRTAFVYQGVARELVHSLKYRRMTALGGTMGSLLAEAARRYGLVVDVAVPVPLAGRRQRIRGYNQAQVLATAVGRALDVPVSANAVARLRNTPPQARSSDAEARRRNVAGVFACHGQADITGRRVLLIDDVATTGATLAACAGALKSAGARTVWGLAFARED